MGRRWIRICRKSVYLDFLWI